MLLGEHAELVTLVAKQKFSNFLSIKIIIFFKINKKNFKNFKNIFQLLKSFRYFPQ